MKGYSGAKQLEASMFFIN